MQNGDNGVIIINNTDVLSFICGVNDCNLKLYEELSGAGVFLGGNEIHLDSADTQKRLLFKDVMEAIITTYSPNKVLQKDTIKTIYKGLKKGDVKKVELLKESCIEIAQGNKAVYPRNLNQALYIQNMQKYDINFAIGPAGTGKTFLAVAYALSVVLEHKMKKLVLTRPVVEAGESLGFLPGDLVQKVTPYLKPLYDSMESLLPQSVLDKMDEKKMIEIVPLAFMRGRSLNNCFIVLDEAQNTSRQQMKMFLTRIGENSKAVITGDRTQIDLADKRSSGLLHVEKLLSSIPEISFLYFNKQDIVRNPLVRKIIKAYESEEK